MYQFGRGGGLVVDVVLVLAGTLALAALIVGRVRNSDPGLLVFAVMVSIGVAFIAAGLHDHLPGRSRQIVRLIAIAAFVIVYAALVVGCLVAPEVLLVPHGSRGPSTAESARFTGLALIAAPVLPGLVVWVVSRRDERPR